MNTHFSRFRHAIVRPPGANFADGLTTVDLGVPDFARTLAQHAAYCAALEACGLTLTALPVDLRYPDSTFVEDTAIVTPHGAVLTRPGAESRAGEVEAMRTPLAAFFPALAALTAPATLDGGDICEAGAHVFIGLSARTNAAGAAQLSAALAPWGYTTACIDIRNTPGILHLKSGLAALDPDTLLVIPALADHPALHGYRLLSTAPGEEYAANCVRVNDVVLVAAGFPGTHAVLRAAGYTLVELEMSEYQKMDGGLSCLSLRIP